MDWLLSRHPDYPKWVAGVPPSDRGRAAFLEASIWPDTIKSDRRFHADNARPTPNIPGLPPGAQARHTGWHYIDQPFSADGTPTHPGEEPNILTVLRELQSLGAMPDPVKVYMLPWLIHLVGDMHQPLHTLQMFDRYRPDGDRGGNQVGLNSGNLHSYWDSHIGTGETDRYLNQLSVTIQQRHPKAELLDMNPEHWAKEGFELRGEVYGFGNTGKNPNPGIGTDAYAELARETSYERAALAGYRLAEFINQRLK